MSHDIQLIWSSKKEWSADDGLPAKLNELPRIESSLAPQTTHASSMPGRLFHGDNLLAMQALMPDYAGKIDLIYIDPPFATGVSYYSQRVAASSGERIRQRAYRDNRARGMQTYLDTMYPRLAAMHRLLSPRGKLFLHCDWRANSMLRLLLDEIFGANCFRNEIIWRRAPNLGRQAASKQLGRVVDTIYVYSKEPGTRFEGEAPKKSRVLELSKKGNPKGARWDEERKAYFTTAPRGDYTDASIEALRKEGRVLDSPSGKVYIKYFLSQDEKGRWVKEQPVDTLWDDYEVRPLRHCPKSEDMGYDTQKPEGLLRRIIRWATSPGDLVADFYCGSGTSLAVAHDLGRHWIGSDIGPVGVATTVRRLKAREATFELYDLLALEGAQWLHDAERLAACKRSFGDTGHALVEGDTGWFHRQDGLGYVAGPGEVLDAAQVDALCRRSSEWGQSRLTIFAWAWAPACAVVELNQLAEGHGIELSQRMLTMEQLRLGLSSRKPLEAPLRSSMDLRLEGEGRPQCLELRGFRCALATTKRSQAAPEWQDLIEEWMVDVDPKEGKFRAAWSSHRADSGGLRLQAHLDTPATGGWIAVRVVTIFGERVERWLSVD